MTDDAVRREGAVDRARVVQNILAAEHIDSLAAEFATFTPEPAAEIDQGFVGDRLHCKNLNARLSEASFTWPVAYVDACPPTQLASL